MRIVSRIIKYGDNIDTDIIIPARYLTSSDEEFLASHVMEDYDPKFKEKVLERKILLAGKNFGLGSSREHAPIALKKAGVQAIVAESFARIFYRNSINQGLPVVEVKGVTEFALDGDEVELDLERCLIKNLTRGDELHIQGIPSFLLEILSSGGLVNYIKRNRESWCR
jgi:3-isopropylmalate/(R)-2-methylmalate dehydratase small subunit